MMKNLKDKFLNKEKFGVNIFPYNSEESKMIREENQRLKQEESENSD